MRVLLLSMPDSFEHMPPMVVRMPSCALGSLAANLDPHHEVVIADLVLVQREVARVLEQLVLEHQPDVVGLSVMTFQRTTARKIIRFLRSLRPGARIVVGGHDPTLAPDSYTDAALGVECIVRGEGEAPFRELLRAMESGRGYETIPGVSFPDARTGLFVHNRSGDASRVGEIRLPLRVARSRRDYTFLGRRVDVVEISRGSSGSFSLHRILTDIRSARDAGARSVVLVDDDIVRDVSRFDSLCQGIVDAGLHHLQFIAQAGTATLARRGEQLAPMMRRAGFRYVFLGIGNAPEAALGAPQGPSAFPSRATTEAIAHLHRNRMFVIGGLVVGNPDDTEESVWANLEYARRHVDWPYFEHPTPWPGTPAGEALRREGLIADRRLEEYDGATAILQTRYLSPEEIEFMRWRVDRWMKVRHVLRTGWRNGYLARSGWRLFAHAFRGSSLMSFLGLEDEHRVFERYLALKNRERVYI